LTDENEEVNGNTEESKTGLDSIVGGAAKHEFDPEERTNSHRLVATAMIVTFLVVAISQDWWKHLRDFIATKTHGPATETTSGGTDQATTHPTVTSKPFDIKQYLTEQHNR
jgi:hypothetical protein